MVHLLAINYKKQKRTISYSKLTALSIVKKIASNYISLLEIAEFKLVDMLLLK